MRIAEREVEISEQLAGTLAIENDPEGASQVRQTRDLTRRLSDLRALRPAVAALIEIAQLVIGNAPLVSIWPALKSFLGAWVLQPGDGPPAHLILEGLLDRTACDQTCGSLSGDNALRVIEEAILDARVPVGRFGDPVVYVGSVRAAVGLQFQAVCVIGLAEGSLPATPREDPVLPDALRDSLRMHGLISRHVWAPTCADRALQDLHAFDTVMRNTGSCIALSTPRLNAERSQREPSSVFLEVAAALGRPNRVTGLAGASIPDATALKRDSFAPAREAATDFRHKFPIGEAAWQDGVAQGAFGLPLRWSGNEALDLNRIAKLLSPNDDDPMDGMLAVSDVLVPGLTPDRPISASALETLLRCPHEFLFKYLLGLGEPAAAPPQRDIGQPAYGSLFHAVAAKFYERFGASFCAREKTLGNWLAAGQQIADDALRDFLQHYPLVGEAVRQQQLERLRRNLRDLIEYDWNTAGRKFVAAERPFGWPDPLELKIGARSLYLRGRIDRIDIEHSSTLVRDLKTGRAHQRIGKLSTPDPAVDLQIAIYGLVAQRMADQWGTPTLIRAAYAYFGRGGGAERAFYDDFHKTLEPAVRGWLETATTLLAERAFLRTPNSDDCGYCSFRPVCGDDTYARTAERLARPGSILAGFAALKGIVAEEPK